MRSCQFFMLGLVSVFVVGSAHAAENGFYVGAAIADTQTQYRGAFSDFADDQDTGFKVMGGWRPADWFAVEGSYFDLGEVTIGGNVPDLSPVKLEQKGYGVFGMLLLDIKLVDLFAKAGIVRSTADLSLSTIAGPLSTGDRDTDLAWGAGAQVRFGQVAARLEYERFQISNGNSFGHPDMVSLGITWTF